MKNRKPLFLVRCCALAWLLQSLATAPAFALCTPAPDPDLDNDGRVTLADVNFVARQFGLPASDPRYNPSADTNCDGKIDKTDLVYVKSAFGKTFPITPTTSIAVLVSATDLNFNVGGSIPLTTGVDFTSSSTTVPFTVQVSQSVTPSTDLTLTPAVGESLNFTASHKTDYAQTLTANLPGTYLITTTTRVVETDQMQSAVTTVTVDPAQVPEDVSMRLDFARRNNPLPLGDSEHITAFYSFFPKDKTKSYTVRLDQTITPATGLQLKPSLSGTIIPIPGGVTEVTDFLSQSIVSSQEGDYDLVTTATVVETGQSISASTHVHVAPAGSPNIGITSLSMKNLALQPDINTQFEVGMSISGKHSDKVQGVTVEERRTGGQWVLAVTSDPRIYKGMITLDTHGMVADDCFTLHSIVHTSKGDATSRDQKLCVTGLPLEFTHTTIEEIDAGFTTSGGTNVAKDLFSVRFKPDVPETRIRQIISAHGGTIVGAWPHVKEIEVRLVPAPDSLKELLTVMHQLSAQPEVLWMDLTYYVDGLLSLQTSDPDSVQQNHLKQIRVDEAWYIARGKGKTIAVFDSGVDLFHPDLFPKLLRDSAGAFLGFDFGDQDNLAYDENSHGSHVAGIAAGATDNAIGIAGIGWDAQILPIKVTKNSSKNFLAKDLVPAIEYVDPMTEVKIINMSLGASLRQLDVFCQLLAEVGLVSLGFCELHDPLDEEAAIFKGHINKVCAVIENSVINHEKLFIAAAGNISHDEKHYPAACPPVVAVAAVDGNDDKAGFSEYGPWIDIAAPGVDIYSTLPSTAAPGCNFTACDYGIKFGTSQAAPMVAGAAALVWAQNPDMTPEEVIERLQKTAKKLTGPDKLGAGRLDVFEAVFNGSFEADSLAGWEHFECLPGSLIDSDRDVEEECTQTDGSSVLKTILGGGHDVKPPTDAKQMAYLTTLPANFTANKVKLRQRFNVQPDVTMIPISFDYAIISDAYPEAFGFHLPDDRLLITFESGSESSGSFVVDFVEPLVNIDLSDESGIDWKRIFDYSIAGGDRSIGWTRWRTETSYVSSVEGAAEFVIRLDDANNPYNDTEVIIDNIRFRPPGS